MSQQSLQERFDVSLLFERGMNRTHAEQTANWFERFPGPVSVNLAEAPLQLHPNSQGELIWEDVFRSLRKYREANHLSPSTFVFLLTSTPNEYNWYAVEDSEQMRNGFGHFGDFKWVTSAPSSAIATHYLLKAIFNSLLDEAGVAWKDMWHEKPRGCFFDFCGDKQDLSHKLRTADICGDCLQIFRDAQIPEALLKQTVAIMEATRKLAINTGQYLEEEASFNDWPFPVAITRHKIVQAINPLLRFMLLLDHFDSLVRFFYLAYEVDAGRTPELIERPSLGWWVEQLAHALSGQRFFREVVSIAEQEKVVALRNERRGHGWMSANEESYRGDAEKLEAAIARIEEEMRPFLEKHRLVIPRDIGLSGGQYVVDAENLVGSHVLHPTVQLTFEVDPRLLGLMSQNEVFLTDKRMAHFRRISPFIRSTTCPECRHPRVLITDGGHQYIDVLIGHRVRL